MSKKLKGNKLLTLGRRQLPEEAQGLLCLRALHLQRHNKAARFGVLWEGSTGVKRCVMSPGQVGCQKRFGAGAPRLRPRLRHPAMAGAFQRKILTLPLRSLASIVLASGIVSIARDSHTWRRKRTRREGLRGVSACGSREVGALPCAPHTFTSAQNRTGRPS